MIVEDTLKQAEEKMKKTIQSIQNDFLTVRTGRANPAILDRLQVDYYGVVTPLKQLAVIGVPDPRTLSIQPFDRASLTAIEKAIQKSDLGLTPSNDGVVIRLNLPPLTEERRKELVKMVKKIAEEGKISIRNTRRDNIELLKKKEKNKEISSDDLKKFQDKIQKLTDKYITDIDKLLSTKEKEIMES